MNSDNSTIFEHDEVRGYVLRYSVCSIVFKKYLYCALQLDRDL